jgi:hypothetical protein
MSYNSTTSVKLDAQNKESHVLQQNNNVAHAFLSLFNFLLYILIDTK